MSVLSCSRTPATAVGSAELGSLKGLKGREEPGGKSIVAAWNQPGLPGPDPWVWRAGGGCCEAQGSLGAGGRTRAVCDPL